MMQNQREIDEHDRPIGEDTEHELSLSREDDSDLSVVSGDENDPMEEAKAAPQYKPMGESHQ